MPGEPGRGQHRLIQEEAVADIFLSFDPADDLAASAMRELLAAKGYSTATERDIPLGSWRDNALESALRDARCVIVLWSGRSRLNTRICNQASFAERHSRYLPVLIEPCEPPVTLLHIVPADLSARGKDIAASANLMIQRIGVLTGEATQKGVIEGPSRRFSFLKVVRWFAIALSAFLTFAVIGVSGAPRNFARYPDAMQTVWTASSKDALCRAPAAARLELHDCAATKERVRAAISKLRHLGETTLALAVLLALLWIAFAATEALAYLLTAIVRAVIHVVTRRDRRLARNIAALLHSG